MNLEKATKLAKQNMKEKLRKDLKDKLVSKRELAILENELNEIQRVNENYVPNKRRGA